MKKTILYLWPSAACFLLKRNVSCSAYTVFELFSVYIFNIHTFSRKQNVTIFQFLIDILLVNEFSYDLKIKMSEWVFFFIQVKLINVWIMILLKFRSQRGMVFFFYLLFFFLVFILGGLGLFCSFFSCFHEILI